MGFNKILLIALFFCITISALSQFDTDTGIIRSVRWSNGVPLGGIGCGKVELLTDGSFANITINNNWDRRTGFIKGSFFAIRTDDGTKKTAKMLRLAPDKADKNTAEPDRIHKNELGLPDDSEYEGVENISNTEYIGDFPFATARYSDPDIPIKIELNAFSPLIPHNIKDSSLPMAFFTFTLQNPTNKNIDVVLLFSWQNLLGFGGTRDIKWQSFEGNKQSVSIEKDYLYINFYKQNKNRNIPPNVCGEYFTAIKSPDIKEYDVSYCWDASLKEISFWKDFRERGEIPDADTGPGWRAEEPAGVVAACLKLKPGQKAIVDFILAWRMKDCITRYIKKTPTGRLMESDAGTFRAFDRNPETRWSTVRPMCAGDSLEIDLGSPMPVTGLLLECRKAPCEYIRGYEIRASLDGQVWNNLTSATEKECYLRQLDNLMRINFPATTRYLKTTVVNSSPDRPWSIDEITILLPSGERLKPISAKSLLVQLNETVIQENVSHYYENHFGDIQEIVDYALAHKEDFCNKSREVPDLINKSNLPPWLKQQLINSAFTMFSNTVFTKDGRFATQESPVSMKGALSTSDQRLAAHAYLTMFFPELDKRELNLFARCQDLVEPVADGRIPHFTGNINEIIGNPNVTSGVRDWPDLSCSYVMQVLKFYRWTGDRAFLQEHWQHVKRAMDWLESADFDGDAIPEGGSSFDYEPSGFGSSSYTAICYLGALKAAEEMARVVGDSVKQKQFQNRFHAVQKSAIQSLWNGKYFVKRFDPRTGKKNTDCFIAQLAGDWMSQLSGLGTTIPDDMRLAAVSEIIRRNVHYTSFALPPMEVSEDGTSATKSCYILQQEPYIAMEAIYAGFVDEGLAIMKRIHDNTWSTNHNPWNECLWVDARTGVRKGLVSYMTSPACWHILNALSGATLNLPDETLYLAPRLPSNMKELHIPLFFPTFWARLDYLPAEKKLTLEIIRVWDGSRGAISRIIGRKSPDPISLKKKFLIRKNETLNLSELFEQLF